jgi:hypothetical protein
MSTEFCPLPAHTRSIESLPNEPLEHVLSFIPMDEPVEYHTPNRAFLPQAIAPMHTSQTFRFVAISSKFWLQHAFHFAALVFDQLYTGREYYINRQTRVSRLCFLLFSIPELAQNLQRKTDWSINKAPEVLIHAVASLPSLEIARRVSLVDDSTLNFLLHRLSYC